MYSILHVEKNEFFRKIVRNMLLEKGFSYFATDNTEEAYNILAENQIDLIITSCLINGDSIENFIKKINTSNHKETPIFVTTSDELDENSKRLMNLGISDYINKESLIDVLLKHIDVVLQDDILSKFLKNSKIAVIDDSNLEAKVIYDMLTSSGIENVDCYTSGKALLESNKKYDLYLIDMILENEYGRNIVMNIRRNNINSSIVVVTALTNKKTLASILNAGADDYITKPLQKDLFISKLKSNVRSLVSMKSMEDKMVNLIKKMDDKNSK